MKELMDIISNRKSVRKYSDKHISDDDLRKILEAGRLAPSWMNVQCWKFILIKSQEKKDMLAELSIGQQHVKDADALIVCIADTNAWKDAKITEIKNPALNPAMQCENAVAIRSLEQVIYPISYMMLEAANLGIGSCIIGAFGNEVTRILPDVQSKIKSELNLKNGQIISTIITLGYELDKNAQATKIRKPFDEVVSLEELGNKF